MHLAEKKPAPTFANPVFFVHCKSISGSFLYLLVADVNILRVPSLFSLAIKIAERLASPCGLLSAANVVGGRLWSLQMEHRL